MRRLIRLVAALAMVLVLATPALAQTGRFYFEDPEARLDRAQVERAAQPLISRGAYVAIYAVDSGQGTQFTQELADDGLVNGDLVRNNLIAIFVSFSDRYSEIRYGDDYKNALNGVSGSIQENTLNANLASGDFSDAFAETLSALNNAIAAGPSGSSTSVGSGTSTPISGTSIAWCVGILAVLGITPFGWQAWSKRQKVAKALASARTGMEEARRKAGAAIADTAQLLTTTQDKVQFDKLTYPANEVTSLAEIQRSAEDKFAAAQATFRTAEDALIAQRTPTEAIYTTNTATYTQVVTQVDEVREMLTQAEARRAELDKAYQEAPGQVEQAKKALADAAGRLGVLSEGANADLIIGPAQTLLSRAESLLADRRAADAIQTAGAASAAAKELLQTLERFGALREQISGGRAGAEEVAKQGYHVEGGLKALNTAEGVLGQATRAIEQGGPPAAAPLLTQAEQTVAEGITAGAGLPALREANIKQIAQLRQEHAAVAAHIAEGRRVFDIVDEFAESTWSDIRGNGSEAEAAHADAGARIDRAEAGNTMEQQEFVAGAADLKTAGERLTFARSLIDTIIQRLKDLEAARTAARDEVAAAKKDIEQGWAFVRSNDADIGKAPEQALAKAAESLAAAEGELGQQRPNWLQVVKLAQEANRLADQALESAQGELQQVAKLREQLQRAQQVAVGEVQKVQQFVGVHGDDILPESKVRIASLQNDVQLAFQAAKSVSEREEQARVAALRDAIEQYTRLQQRTEQLYNDVHQAFQAAEGMRQRVAAEVREAEQAIERADRARREGGGMVAGGSQGFHLLEQARETLGNIGSVNNERTMQAAIQRANDATSAANRAEAIFREEIRQYRDRQRSSADDVIKGAVIGSLLGGGGGHHHGGSSGGSRGSSGGSSWGSGGSSGGSSWGGGGSSGGSGW